MNEFDYDYEGEIAPSDEIRDRWLNFDDDPTGPIEPVRDEHPQEEPGGDEPHEVHVTDSDHNDYVHYHLDYPLDKDRVFGRGSEGEGVKFIQIQLGLEPTGVYDARTERAVRAAQRSAGKTPTGLVGERFWNYLKSLD
jgi:peptidoglycan hydrolase-like protein with peptidoglycan-binding domain